MVYYSLGKFGSIFVIGDKLIKKRTSEDNKRKIKEQSLQDTSWL